jgi:tetraacyldisaccharide 4'-kinase
MMSEWLQKIWYSQFSPWHLLLVPFSWVFGLLTLLRRFAYRSGVLRVMRLPVPVIVVGNITVGGTGKTPLVIWLTQQLAAAGYRPGIISRGYGGRHLRPMSVAADADPGIVGDEPVMMASRTGVPVWVGRDRVAVGEALLAQHPECDIIICDDGLQHYRLWRNFEIVVVDGERRFGNGRLLPAGPLRESESRLRTVDAVVCNGSAGQPDWLAMELVPEKFRRVLDDAEVSDSQEFFGKRIMAMAGIGNPARFFSLLRRLGVQAEVRAFPDHHGYRREDLMIPGVDAILMTEKDAVKCRAFAQAHVWYLPVAARLDGRLLERIVTHLRNK